MNVIGLMKNKFNMKYYIKPHHYTKLLKLFCLLNGLLIYLINIWKNRKINVNSPPFVCLGYTSKVCLTVFPTFAENNTRQRNCTVIQKWNGFRKSSSLIEITFNTIFVPTEKVNTAFS